MMKRIWFPLYMLFYKATLLTKRSFHVVSRSKLPHSGPFPVITGTVESPEQPGAINVPVKVHKPRVRHETARELAETSLHGFLLPFKLIVCSFKGPHFLHSSPVDSDSRMRGGDLAGMMGLAN